MPKRSTSLLGAMMSCCLAAPAHAAEGGIDPADTGFVIVATALVLMMTLPALALFYAGMVRKKSLLAVMAQSVAATAVVSILWFALGYSLAFSGDGAAIGDFARVFARGIGLTTTVSAAPTIPELLFLVYQMTFAVITCALVGGAVADRMNFSAFVAFCVVWLFLVYVPTAHWVWGGGFLAKWGLLDFAGGTVVHVNAGIAGLVAALMLGNRMGYGRENLAPYDLSMAVVGTGLLWVGWFGFNGGSALSASSRAVFAVVATHLSACAGAVAWTILEWWHRGRPSVLGMISGAIAGLGMITPASGYVEPWAGLTIGLVGGLLCYWFCSWLKVKLAYDDSLDVFGVHGVGGLVGTVLVGVFASSAVTGDPAQAGLIEGRLHLLGVQAAGVAIVALWCAGGTYLALKAASLVAPLRVDRDQEREGLDLAIHGETIHA
ncbi:MAG: ammonium transporter [Phyllobacteriaceae bacterium]|nr:ammonium transporter [Phyllobacteriaceae bacterium]